MIPEPSSAARSPHAAIDPGLMILGDPLHRRHALAGQALGRVQAQVRWLAGQIRSMQPQHTREPTIR
jgi:hypothetical protein